MRLLQRLPGGNFELVSFEDDNGAPPYAILSHTWTDGQEFTYRDFVTGTGRNKTGFEKIRFCSERAEEDLLQYFWVDTCCIDKSSSTELSTAINSMFRWYQNAVKCYVYLSDVSVAQADVQYSRPLWETAFRASRWFKRGWTLQELIAPQPQSIVFFSLNGCRLGDKKELAQHIHEVTGIPAPVLRGAALSGFHVNERMLWAQGRETQLPEDRAYSLLGILGVFMPLIYGEGLPNALNRLERELMWKANEQEPSVSSTLILNPHPVTRRNYRKVIVVIISWKCDSLEMTIEAISNVFQQLYRYEVRRILLPTDDRYGRDLHWPWPDNSDIQNVDLQILYYLGSTRRIGNAHGLVDIQAAPILNLDHSSDQISGCSNWLSMVIGIPNLTSDVLLILDCYVEVLAEGSREPSLQYLFDDSIPWARYGILVAGYSSNSSHEGRFSSHFMSVLRDLAHSEPLANVASVMRNLMEEQRSFDNDPMPIYLGNDGTGSIILSPIES